MGKSKKVDATTPEASAQESAATAVGVVATKVKKPSKSRSIKAKAPILAARRRLQLKNVISAPGDELKNYVIKRIGYRASEKYLAKRTNPKSPENTYDAFRRIVGREFSNIIRDAVTDVEYKKRQTVNLHSLLRRARERGYHVYTC